MGRRIVIWSGGYDSTLCLLRELEKRPLVEAWSFKWNCLGDLKTKCEFKIRRKFKAKIRRRGWVIDHKIITLKHPMLPEGIGVMQASLFLPLINYLAPLDSTIIWGFHWKDDYWMYHDKFMELIRVQNDLMGKKVNHEFPLKDMKKWQVIYEIKKLKFEKYVWTCENPIDILKPCYKCDPCIYYKLALKEKELREASRPELKIYNKDEYQKIDSTEYGAELIMEKDYCIEKENIKK